MKKKNKILIGLIIVIVILIIVYFLCNKFILGFYSSSYFKLDFDNNWKVTYKDHSKLFLKNYNNSVIQVIGMNVSEDVKNKEDIYFELERSFQKKNKDYRLINYQEIEVGAKYYDAYQYLFENDVYQISLIEVVRDNKALYIICSSYLQHFDLELDNFNNVINSIEI